MPASLYEGSVFQSVDYPVNRWPGPMYGLHEFPAVYFSVASIRLEQDCEEVQGWFGDAFDASHSRYIT